MTRRYAGLVAVDALDMAVPQGGVHAVIGPNGAGKTTLFNLLSGIVTPSAGRIRFADADDITELPAHRRAAAGLARTFQNIRIFGAMTVLENVLTGLHLQARRELCRRSCCGLGGSGRRSVRRWPRRSRHWRWWGCPRGPAEPAGALSYGDQRRLEIARAMAASPAAGAAGRAGGGDEPGGDGGAGRADPADLRWPAPPCCWWSTTWGS